MRWRLIYSKSAGFQYSTQPERSSRRQDDKAGDDHDKIWLDPTRAWALLRAWEATLGSDHFPQGRTDIVARQIQVSDGNPDINVECRNTFRFRLIDCIPIKSSPSYLICRDLANRVVRDAMNPLVDPMHLKQTIIRRRQRELPLPGAADALSSLPLELLDLIIGSALNIHLSLVVAAKTPHFRETSDAYTPSERAALASLPHSQWPYFTSLPFFNVSRLLRSRTVAVLDRRFLDSGERTALRLFRSGSGSATLRCDSAVQYDDGQLYSFACGNSQDGEYRTRKSTGDSHYLWGSVKQLDIVATWDFSTKRLRSPLSRMIGFESEFHSLNHIRVRVEVVGAPAALYSTASTSSADHLDIEDEWKDLAQALYGVDGAYNQVAAEIGRNVDVAIWAALTKRTGIWPGYCVSPQCIPGQPHTCPTHLPSMSGRMPTIDVDLLPLL